MNELLENELVAAALVAIIAALAGIGLKYAKKYAKKTETTLDDQLIDAVEDVLEKRGIVDKTKRPSKPKPPGFPWR